MGKRPAHESTLGENDEHSKLSDVERFKLRRFRGNVWFEDYYERKEKSWLTSGAMLEVKRPDRGVLEVLSALERMDGKSEKEALKGVCKSSLE